MHFIVNNIGKIAIVLLLSILVYFNTSINYLKQQDKNQISAINTSLTMNREVKGMIIKVDNSRKTNELILLRDLTVINMELVEIQNKLILHKAVLQKEVLYNRRLARKVNACIKRCEE